MTTDFRALCAELVDEITYLAPIQSPYNDLIARARAALAEPEPERPTDADLHAMAFSYSQPCYKFEYIPFARAVLARWGK